MSCQSSLYDRLGGKPVVDLAVGVFYKKVVSDKRISGVFSGVNLQSLMCMMKKFLRKATGGESEGNGGYEGRNMYEAHRTVNNGTFPTSQQYDILLQHFLDTLQYLGVKNAIIDEFEVIVESLRPQILGLENPDANEPVN